MSLIYLARLILMAIAILMVALAAFAYVNRRYRIPGTPAYIILCLLSAVYIGGCGYELGQETLEGFFLAVRIEYLGISFVPAAWIALALAFTGRERQLNPVIMTGMLAWSIAILVAVWTNNGHHLYYRAIEPSGQTGLAHFLPGDIYPLGPLAYIGALVLGAACLRGLNGQKKRKQQQRIVLGLASAIPLIGSLAYTLQFRPSQLDLTPFTLATGVAIMGIGLFRNRLLSLVPIARERVIESMPDAVLVIDAQHRILDFNPAARGMFPQLNDQAIGLICHEAGSPCAELGDALLRKNAETGEFSLGPSQTQSWFQFTRSAIADKKGRQLGHAIVIKDQTDRHALFHQISELRSTDALTGSFNRQRFQEIAETEIRRAMQFGHQLSLIVIRLSDFTELNRQLGRSGADRVLRDISQRIAALIRTMDTLARTGSAEFTILMPDSDQTVARETALRILGTIHPREAIPGGPAPLSLNVGISELHAADWPHSQSEFPEPASILDALGEQANAALKRARTAGVNQVAIHGLG